MHQVQAWPDLSDWATSIRDSVSGHVESAKQHALHLVCDTAVDAIVDKAEAAAIAMLEQQCQLIIQSAIREDSEDAGRETQKACLENGAPGIADTKEKAIQQYSEDCQKSCANVSLATSNLLLSARQAVASYYIHNKERWRTTRRACSTMP